MFKNQVFKRQYLIALCITLILFSISIIAFAFFKNSSQLSIVDKNLLANATPKPLNENNPEKGVYNILLLGYGGGNHEGSLLTDSIIVANVNTNTKKLSLISIPRDLWVPGDEKINSVGVSGFEKIGPAITGITGLPINYYSAVNFDNFEKLIDNLDGITVKIPKTFEDNFYPILGEENNVCGKTGEEIFQLKNKYGQTGFELEKQFTCRYERLYFEGGKEVAMDGKTALKFVRSRHGDSDYGRSQRQFAVLEAVGQKLITLKSLNKLEETISILFNMVKTDLDLGTIKTLTQMVLDPEKYSVNNIQLSTENVFTESKSQGGAFIVIPKAGNMKFDGVKEYIKSQIK